MEVNIALVEWSKLQRIGKDVKTTGRTYMKGRLISRKSIGVTRKLETPIKDAIQYHAHITAITQRRLV